MVGKWIEDAPHHCNHSGLGSPPNLSWTFAKPIEGFFLGGGSFHSHCNGGSMRNKQAPPDVQLIITSIVPDFLMLIILGTQKVVNGYMIYEQYKVYESMM